jgi:hypothetical protein
LTIKAEGSTTANKQQASVLFVWLIKVFVGGAGAFVVLNFFSLFYSTSLDKIHSESLMTDYAWGKGSFYSKLTEGFGIGFMDKNGYNNAASLAENPTPDVLVIGSSHMEAFQVAQNESFAYVLDAELSPLDAYSIGVSGNSILTCVKNYECALQTENPKYAVMETDTVSFAGSSVEDAVNGILRDVGAFAANDIIRALSRIPYLRLLYGQLEKINGGDIEILSAKVNAPQTDNTEKLPANIEQLNVLTAKIRAISTENGVTPIIFYHPHLTINGDGTVTAKTDETDLKNFAAACENNGVCFVDLTDTFIDAYYNEHILPHGFFNTEISTGHLNADGHRMAAEQIARVITVLEQWGRIQ